MYYWLPESLAVAGKQTVESRRVGIYSGQVWHNVLQIKASFDPLRLAALRKTNIVLGQPRLVVSVGDARGIGAIHAPEVNGNVLSVEPGLGISGDGAGIHMPMPALAEDNKPLEIAFSLDLNGTGEFSLVPLGRNSELQLTSNWPHRFSRQLPANATGSECCRLSRPLAKQLVRQRYGELFQG